jgi:AAA domain
MTDRLGALIGRVALELLGEPNKALSSKKELRFGSRGSMAVDLQKGTWFDHEAGEGGGTLDLITRETGRKGRARFDWLEEHGYELPERQHTNGHARSGAKLGPIVATYDYVDEAGAFLFQVTRHDPPKDFRQRKRDAAGEWVWCVRGVRQVPYRLPELTEAISGDHVVFVVEGEKDADNLWKLGAPATTNAGGVGKWGEELTAFFDHADVVVIPDNDPQARHKKTGALLFHDDGRPKLPGQDHAQDVARHLNGVAARVRVLDLGKIWPACPPKGDVSDWLEAGHSVEQLFELIERLPDWSPEAALTIARLIRSSAEFVAGFVPPDYVVGGILQHRFFYSFTGKTGAGKTAIMLLLAASVALGHLFGDRKVKRGRVLYFAGENPDDIRMRWIALSQHMSFDIDTIDVHFIPGTFKISEMQARIRAEIERIGEFALIMIDTSSAYFEGDDENDNKQAGDHARRLRGLVGMRGGPCVLVACHPPKNAGDDNLQPRGGGAFIAEVDGNLTAKHANSVVELHWQGKFRGPDFAPLSFQCRSVTHERLKDSDGQLLPTVIGSFLSEGAQREIAEGVRSREDQILAELANNGPGSQADLARRLDWRMGNGEPYKSQVKRMAQSLMADKLITHSERDGYAITAKGREKIAPSSEPDAKRKSRPPQLPLVPMLIEDRGPAKSGLACSACFGIDDVRQIKDAREAGSKTHPLHEKCARKWFGIN